MSRFVIKLGSAIVTRDEVMTAVCDEVRVRRERGDQVVLVSSGAVARGLEALGRPVRPTTIQEMQAASAVGQGSLFRRWDELLAERGVLAAQVLLTSFDLSVRMHYLNARQSLRKLLEWRAVPVVNENDTTATDEITFGDNDFLSAQLALLLGARLLVLLTDTDGLHTADPGQDPDARRVPVVDDFAELDGYAIGDRASLYGSGGMRSKVSAAGRASAAGIAAAICDGTADGSLLAASRGEDVGTRFVAHPERTPSFKLWLRHAKPARGRVVVDEGAARVLRESGSSLLPVGIVGIDGEFAAGDAVDVVCDGAPVGKGIVNYSSAELVRIKGLKSAEVLELLPNASEEAVHRDRFVLA
jgi:glutamate 5-kinase